MAFYSGQAIRPLVPKILESHEDVVMEAGAYPGALGKLVDRLLSDGARPEGGHYKVLLLSAPDAPETVRLENPIRNDLLSQSGKPLAFTMGQRYVTLERLRAAKTTSDLLDDK